MTHHTSDPFEDGTLQSQSSIHPGPTAPAILNAIRDAAGAAIRRLPATPDRVLEAIRKGAP